MRILSLLCVPVLAAGLTPTRAVPGDAEARRCRLVPGTTLAVMRVEKDTVLAFSPTSAATMSMSGVAPGPRDSIVATAATPMPAARVRLLELDSVTRAAFARAGIAAAQPPAFIRAAPYRADCRTIQWTDTVPFVQRGEVGFIRAVLAPRDQWVEGLPVLIVSDAWNYPYPRRRGLASGAPPGAPLASASAMFGIHAAVEMRDASGMRDVDDNTRSNRAIAWARRNPDDAELEPVRTILRRAILDPAWGMVGAMPSRLRGTYRVQMEVGADRSTWFFRTHERPGYAWHGGDSLQRTIALLASPHVGGYRLVGYAVSSPDSLPRTAPSYPMRLPLVWLATNDRPLAPGNDIRRTLSGVLEFELGAVPERLWNDLEPLVARQGAQASLMFARIAGSIPRGQRQPRIAVQLHLDERGRIHADTTVMSGKRSIRMRVDRVDTVSVRRSY